MVKGITFEPCDGSQLQIGIVTARWNTSITSALEKGAVDALRSSGVARENIIVHSVPGSFELVYGAKQLASSQKVDAVIAIGCLIKGETMHFEYIADAVSQGLMRLNLEQDVPIIFGVLTCLTEEQAVARSSGDNNHGYGWGMSAVEMALLRTS